MKQLKLEARERKAQLLTAALEVSKTVGFARVTRDQIAARAGCAPTLVAHYFGTMTALRRDIMREAVRAECLPVLAQGLAVRDPHAAKAPEGLRIRAIDSLRGA